MPLTDTAARQARGRDKPYKLADQGGLYLWIAPSGTKSWRYDFRHVGRRYTLTLGLYARPDARRPDVTLEQARERHSAARKFVAAGQNPAMKKQTDRQKARHAATNSFEAIAEDWLKKRKDMRSEDWLEAMRRWFKRDVYPAIGSKPIEDVTAEDVRGVLRKILKRGTHRTAEYTRGAIAQVFHHAILDGRAKNNPGRELVGFIERPPVRHHAHLEGKHLPSLFQAIDNYGGRIQTKLALKLLALTFVRVRELIEATWDEFDLEHGIWTIPAHRMKARKPHVVPLSDQALELLARAKTAATGSRFVFPSLSRLDRPISATTLNFALDEMGFAGRLTPHGLRATASTVLNGMGFSPDMIEKQLAHVERNPVRAAYNHSDLLPERRGMMQRWSDYIDGLCAGAKVTPIRRAA